jgi:predicted negative regulator of RcsB-dependent stress response
MQTTPQSDAPAEMLIKLWPWLEANKTKLIGAVVAVVIVFGVWNFLASQKESNEIAAGQALTQLLMTPPSGVSPSDALAQLAVKYSGTAAAQRAQLQAAATLFSGARYADAQAAFEKFLAGTSAGPMAVTAQLGLGASLEAQGKLDLAAATYQKVAATVASNPSALPALCALGRIAESQGKLAEAANNYEAAARAGQLGGSLAQEAGMHAAELKAKIAAAPKAIAPAAQPVVAPAK